MLYHGTTDRVARLALTDGLKPRKEVKRSNWAHTVPSHPNAVYLTSVYPLYFAIQAANTYSGKPGEQSAVGVVEVDPARLVNLVPDEDALEQVGRPHDDLPAKWTMRQRTLHYRKELHTHVGFKTWETSLKALGTCAHLGAIPARAVRRVAIINVAKQAELLFHGMQPLISVLNFRHMGEHYRDLTGRIWDGGDGIEIISGEASR